MRRAIIWVFDRSDQPGASRQVVISLCAYLGFSALHSNGRLEALGESKLRVKRDHLIAALACPLAHNSTGPPVKE
jgi:hypothetical protein